MSQHSQGDSPSVGGAINRRTRRHRPRPTRLAWPVPLSSQDSKEGQSSLRTRKGLSGNRQRSTTASPATRTNATSTRAAVTATKNNNNSLMIRKRPRKDPLALTYATASSIGSMMWVDKHKPSNVKDLCVAPKKVKEVQAWIQESQNTNKLLILVGSPGIGKSTMIHVIAKELDIQISEWKESMHLSSTGGGGHVAASSSSGIASVDQSKPLDSFQEFLQNSGAGFHSLNVGNSFSTKSTFTQQLSSSPYRKADHKSNKQQQQQQRLILLDELPYLHGNDAEERFRAIMNRHLRTSRIPTVFIFSDVSEGKHKPEHLERLIDSQDLYYSQLVTIMQIHPVTKAKLKNIMEGILEKEGRTGLKHKIDWEELQLKCQGDLRHALLSVQTDSAGHVKHRRGNNSNWEHKERDTKLSTFHSLGKLLYAKQTTKNGKSVLAFDPEMVMEQNEMGIDGALHFLQYHSPDFFTDIEDISEAFDTYSDAAFLLDTQRDFRNRYQAGVPPGGQAAASLAGRAVANANRSPAPNKFRQFSTPKFFEVNKKRRNNAGGIEQLFRRLWLHTGYVSLNTAFADSTTLVTDFIPSMRIIAPEEVNPSVQNLYSMARTNNLSSDMIDSVAAEEERLELEQDTLLAEDDIDEDSDDDDDDVVGGNISYCKSKNSPLLATQASLVSNDRTPDYNTQSQTTQSAPAPAPAQRRIRKRQRSDRANNNNNNNNKKNNHTRNRSSSVQPEIIVIDD